jgi:hypothetical protein
MSHGEGLSNCEYEGCPQCSAVANEARFTRHVRRRYSVEEAPRTQRHFRLQGVELQAGSDEAVAGRLGSVSGSRVRLGAGRHTRPWGTVPRFSLRRSGSGSEHEGSIPLWVMTTGGHVGIIEVRTGIRKTYRCRVGASRLRQASGRNANQTDSEPRQLSPPVLSGPTADHNPHRVVLGGRSLVGITSAAAVFRTRHIPIRPPA